MSTLARNILWMLLSQLATWSITLVMLVIAPDHFGPAGFGVLTYATAYVGFFALAASFGTGAYLTKSIARDPDSLPDDVFNALVMKLFILAGVTVAAMTLVVALGQSRTTIIVVAITCLGMWFTVLNEAVSGALGGLERMARPALWGAIQVYVASAIGLVVIATDRSIEWYALGAALAAAVPLVANTWALRHRLRHHGGIDFARWKRILRGGFPLMVLGAFMLVYGTTEIPILEAVSGKTVVGWYGVAYRWVAIPMFIATAVVNAYFPRLSALGRNAGPEFAYHGNRAIRLVMLVSVPAAAGIASVAPSLMAFIYDGRYDESIVLIQILSLQIPLTAFDTVLVTMLVATDRVRGFVIVAGVAAALNPLMCLVAIPLADRIGSNGAIGAAIVTNVTELIVLVGALRLRPAGVLDRASVGVMARGVLAAMVMVVAVVLVRDLHLFVQIAIGVVAYAGAVVAFGALRRQDLDELMSKVRPRATAVPVEGK